MPNGTENNQVAHGNIYSGSGSGQHNTFNNQQNQGRLVGGTIIGGTVNQGDTYNHSHIIVLQRGCNAYPHETRQFPSTSLSISSKPNAEDRQHILVIAQQSLKEMYLTRFEKVYPFSLPFTFDIENTWVSLALKEGNIDSKATEDHAELLMKAFDQVKMLIIEGDPATGKTSLMRRLAYEWAKGKQELLCYDLVLYAEFREVREKTFQSVADLVLGGLENYLDDKDIEALGLLLNDKQFCQQKHLLLLLDGYDESSLVKQCSDLSSYLTEKTIKKRFFFNTVITTRKGPLSNCRDLKGRYIFAEVLGFTTKEQKEKYIFKHFLSKDIDNTKNIAAVYHLLANNENLNKLAETPLYLTFICLVHEKIVDGTLLELYSCIIWWLIDRHQQDFPDRDIPALFGFQNVHNDKFETIQDHYLHFPQLHCLGNMALHNLQVNVFKSSDCAQFNLQPIVEQVGLLRKEKQHDNLFKLVTTYYFPHRTIQEFLAAFYCFCSNHPTSEWLSPYSDLYTTEMSEFMKFLLRIALSDKMPVHGEKHNYYFKLYDDLNLDIKFDAFITTAGFNSKLLNRFLSQCTNVQKITLNGTRNSEKHFTMVNDTFIHNESPIASKMFCPILLPFSNLMKLHLLSFWKCTFIADSHLSFTNCPSLKNLQFKDCEIASNANLGFATLPAVDSVNFCECKFDIAAWQSITKAIRSNFIKCLQLIFGDDFQKEFFVHLQKCNNVESLEITIRGYEIHQNDLLSFSELIKLRSLVFEQCAFEANSQLSFTNCPFLKNLHFKKCEMIGSTKLGIAALSAINTVEFDECKMDLVTWLHITNDIRSTSVRFLKLTFGKLQIEKILSFKKDFNEKILVYLQNCNNVEKIEVIAVGYNFSQNDLLSFSDLVKLHSLTLLSCIFEADSQLSFANCFSLTNLQFDRCRIESSTKLGFGILLATETLSFDKCTFEANSQLCFTNYSSLKNLQFNDCEMKSNTILSIITLPAICVLELNKCKIDLATWQSIIHLINNSPFKCLKLIFGEEFIKEILICLEKCSDVEEIEIEIQNCKIWQNDLLSFSDLVKLRSLKFSKCAFEANSQLSMTNCPSLQILQFYNCEIKSIINFGIISLPAIYTVGFYECKFDLTAWLSITDAISNSSVRCLQLTTDYFVKKAYPELLLHLQKCEKIEELHVKNVANLNVRDNILDHYEEEVTANLAQTAEKLPGLKSLNLDKNSIRLKERNKERIENGGQARNPEFFIKYID